MRMIRKQKYKFIKNAYQLVERDLRSTRVINEPPRVSKDSSATNVYSNDHVSEEKPFSDEGFAAISWRNAHDGVVRGIETERCCWQAVCHQVDPE